MHRCNASGNGRFQRRYHKTVKGGPVIEMPIGAHCDMIERVHVQQLASCLSIALEKSCLHDAGPVSWWMCIENALLEKP